MRISYMLTLWQKETDKRASSRRRRLEPVTMIPRVKWVPLETPYVGVPGTNTVLVDATGVGAPVIEMLTASGLLGRPAPVMVPRGQNMGLMKGAETVPRRALLGSLRSMLETGVLRARVGLDGWEELRREMVAMGRRGVAGGLSAKDLP